MSRRSRRNNRRKLKRSPVSHSIDAGGLSAALVATKQGPRFKWTLTARLLLSLGLVLLGGAFALPVWNLVGEQTHYGHGTALELGALPARASEEQPLPTAATPVPTIASGLPPAPTPIAQGAATSLPTPTPEPSPAPRSLGSPVKLAIPRIDIVAPIDPVGVKEGAYDVPWWDVGWQKDSAPLGEPGNTILNGHVHTIDAGDVFNRLKDLKPGDMVYVFSRSHRTAWIVESTEAVPNTESGFVGRTDDLRLTMYTCEGTFDWRTRTFSEYRVVVAKFAGSAPLQNNAP